MQILINFIIKYYCSIYKYMKVFISIYNSLSQQRLQDFGSGGGTSDKISHMNSTQVLYFNGIAKISVRGDIQQKMYSSKTFDKVWKVYKKFVQKFKKFSKIFQK